MNNPIKWIGQAMLLLALLVTIAASASAEIWIIYRQRGQDCKDSAYAFVSAEEVVLPNGANASYMECTGCGPIPCTCDDVIWRLSARHNVSREIDQAIRSFRSGERTGGVWSTLDGRTVTTTWVGSTQGGVETQNIRVEVHSPTN
mgnify:FL=1